MAHNLKIKAGGTNNLFLKPPSSFAVMEFNGTGEYIQYTPTGCVDVCTNRKMTFRMILDASNGFNNNGLFNFRNPVGTSSPGDSWEAQLDGSMLHVDIGSGGYNARYA